MGDAATLFDTIGRTLFGAAPRMHVGVWVATMSDDQANAFWGSQYSTWAIGQGKTAWVDAGPQLRRFRELGMISEVARDRATVYTRNPSPLWDIFCMVDVVLGEIEEPGSRRFFRPTAERVAAMIEDLRVLRSELEPIGSE